MKNVDEPVKIHFVVGKDIKIPSQKKIKLLRKEPGISKTKITRHFKHPLFYLLIALFLVLLFTNKYWYNVKPERTVQAIAVLPFAQGKRSIEESRSRPFRKAIKELRAELAKPQV